MMVGGIDLSLTRTGIALPSGELHTVAGPTGLPAAKHRTVNDRADRLIRIATRVVAHFRPWPCELIVMEVAESSGHGGLTTLQLIGLGELVRCHLHAAGFELAEVHPSALKKWATGNGRAEKPAMIEAARARGYRPRHDDEADAALLREWGIEHAAGGGATMATPTTTRETT